MTNCLICNIIEGKTKVKKIYEDDDVVCILNPTPATFGHSLVIPKKHLQIITQIEDETIKKMFLVSQQISSLLFESTGAEGTNIIIQNGIVAGQKHPHFLIHILPRSKDDGISFEWPRKQIPEESMNKIEEMLKVPEKKKELKREAVEEGKKEARKPLTEGGYLLKQLKRIP